MSKHEKLLKRIAARPKDFAWSELVALMSSLSFEMERSSGSGRKFINADTQATLLIHEPHPAKTLKSYQVHDAVHFLKEEGYLS